VVVKVVTKLQALGWGALNMGLGCGFCVVGSRVSREVCVADFAMSGWEEMA
jgi:hypothetical protein